MVSSILPKNERKITTMSILSIQNTWDSDFSFLLKLSDLQDVNFINKNYYEQNLDQGTFLENELFMNKFEHYTEGTCLMRLLVLEKICISHHLHKPNICLMLIFGYFISLLRYPMYLFYQFDLWKKSAKFDANF